MGNKSTKSVDKDEASLLDRKPSLKHLQNIVVPRVSSNWKTIGLNLDIEDFRLSAIEKSKHYQTDDCCTEMFSMWLSLAPHTGSLPLTWRSVLSAIEKVERVTSEELLAELKRSVESSLPQEPTQQATHKLAGELKAYYNRLEPVVRDGFTPRLEFVHLAAVEHLGCGLRKKEKLEEFLRATMNGIDEIYEKFHYMEYCDILTFWNAQTPGKHIIISGAPGSGKTTLVRQLCKDLSSGSLPNDYSLVVLVELRELIVILQDKKEAQLHHFLTKFKHKVDVSQACRELEESDGRGMLLVLDGFDELDARMRKCQLLRDLLSSESNYLPKCDIIVTSRPVTCPDLLGLMKPLHRHVEILGFSEDGITSFIRNYFETTPLSSEPPLFQPPLSQPPLSHPISQVLHESGCEAEKLLSRLDQLPQVKGMCRTPVVVKIVCKVCQILGAASLPATMTGIYKEFILRQLLENGPIGAEASSILHIPSSDYPFFGDLCRIAFECCTHQRLMISKQDLGDTLPPLVRGSIYGLLYADPVEDLRAVRELELYHFMHKTVQEALAACHVAVLPNPESHMEVWRKWFGRPEMAEVWKFYCGLTRLEYVDISSIVQLLGEANQSTQTLLMVSLFEAGNGSLAREVLPRICPARLNASLFTSYETAVHTFALQHHPSLESLRLSWTGASVWLDGVWTTPNVSLQPLLDALLCHPTVKELFVIVVAALARMPDKDHQALCRFLSGNHRLTKVTLQQIPEQLIVAALSTESSTMEELECDYAMPVYSPQLAYIFCRYHDEQVISSPNPLIDPLRSTPLRRIAIKGPVAQMGFPILRGLAANTSTIDRTVMCFDTFMLAPLLESQLPELRQFLVPCVKCHLTLCLPVGVWGTILSGVGAARQLEWLRVHMHDTQLEYFREAGQEWDHIDQTTLEEVETSWAHSRCREVVFDITDSEVHRGSTVSLDGLHGNTLDATMKLLCAAVRGIIQRKDHFVVKLQVNHEQVSSLGKMKQIARSKCAVTVSRRELDSKTVTVLELKPR